MSRRRKVDALFQVDYERRSYARRDWNDEGTRNVHDMLREATERVEALTREVDELKAKNQALETKNLHLISALQAEYTLDELSEPANSEFMDRTLPCKECGEHFVFRAGQQEDYDRRGLWHDPVRCKQCRDQMRDRYSHTITDRVVEYAASSGYKDKALECRDCGAEFIFTASQQESYNLRGLVHDPARCKECREAIRQGHSKQPQRVQAKYKDRVLDCRDCASKFVFPADQQEDYERRGLMNDPSRCKECRDIARGGGSGIEKGSNVGASSSIRRQFSSKKTAIQDMTLTCKDCACTFVFSVAHQEDFQRRGLQHAPSRCKECRIALRDQKSHHLVEDGMLTDNAPLWTSR